ncbi:hypothetical protein [Nitrospirillum iridis]|uniref:Uncharacterized protein n=1 Tax=Nitrospirillum iridis TaxID=765888 RepID=A0A7X0B421_9PROT|nr:hypothetical protein [Nitrospirillum iridis]MBB6254305.1 hypothetical protein [Nitrospirillum iridis]
MEQAIVTVQNLAGLAQSTQAGMPLGKDALLFGEDGTVQLNRQRSPSRHHFYLDGLMFHVSITPQEDSTLFQIWAEVGFMPYTIEAPEKRAKLQAILRATSNLRAARFIVDEQQKVLVLGQQEVPGHVNLTDLMYETVQFIQEARPYLRVFGSYL